MRDFNLLIIPTKGKKTTLDKAYQKHVVNIIKTLSEDEEARWETYSIIFQQLMNYGQTDIINEIKYRLTDGENPNIVLLDVINRDSDSFDNLTWFLKRSVEEYLDEDLLKRFLP
jgi:hypothetical protein